MKTNLNHQDTKSLHLLRSETEKLRQVAKSRRVKKHKRDLNQTESSAKSQQFSSLMQSERFVALATYFESLEKLLPSANEHKTTQDDTVQKSAFLAACALWWEVKGMQEDKDGYFPLQIQDIFDGLDSALTKQRVRRNPWYPTWRK